MQRIIFVGLHNKPGKVPLSPNTITGKRVSKMIQLIKNKAEKTELPLDFLKTNMFDIDHMPEPSSVLHYVEEFVQRIQPQHEDVIILLGSYCHKYLGHRLKNICHLIMVNHPAYVMSAYNVNMYIAEVNMRVWKILKNKIPII